MSEWRSREQTRDGRSAEAPGRRSRARRRRGARAGSQHERLTQERTMNVELGKAMGATAKASRVIPSRPDGYG
jgi:hypothetical protein